jgi:quercetin dioxygenase-like cupin family protein
MNEQYIKNIDFEKVFGLRNLMGYVEGGVESRTLVQREDFSMTLFSFDKGEGVSAYSMPGDTMIYVYEGIVEVIIDETKKYILNEGETIVVPSDALHSIDTIEHTKIMIVILKLQN